MYADKLRKLQHHAKHLTDVIPEDAKKVLSLNNNVADLVKELQDRYKSRFTSAMVANFAKTEKKSYEDIVLMGNSSTKYKVEIIPECVILSTTKELSKNTAIIHVSHHPVNEYWKDNYQARFNMVNPESFQLHGLINQWTSSRQVDICVQDILIDLVKAYEVVNGSVPFRSYLKDQFVNNVL
jgi:hypothetical protein